MQQGTAIQTPDPAAVSRLVQQATQQQVDAATLSRQIREQVRQQVQAAQAQARAAREQARAAQEQAQQAAQSQTAPPAPPPVPEVASGTSVPPFNIDPFIPARAEHIAVEFFAMMVAIFFVVPIARAFARRIDKKPVATPLDHSLTEQLQRIENSVDSMAIEIERISEAQRYMARLQSDRAAAPALPPKQAAS